MSVASVALQPMIALIARRTGLSIREQDQSSLEKKLSARLKDLRLPSLESYYQLLSGETNASRAEWATLLSLITTGESYFLRDRGQFQLLRDRLLPELIAKRRAIAGNGRPSLRLWSAGCSTGEEPHSLAMVLQVLIPDLQAWDCFILGTDINPTAIAAARQGIYSHWSFRMMDANLQTQYFTARKQEWLLDDAIRQLVTFQTGNLVCDPFPNPASSIYDFDLILCRNVFIYFDSTAVATVLNKFARSLRPEGYLMVGHTELHGHSLGHLEARVFPESVVYQQRHPFPAATVEVPQPSLAVTTAPLPSVLATTVQTSPPVDRPPIPAPVPAAMERTIPGSGLPPDWLTSLEEQMQRSHQQGNYPAVIQVGLQMLQHHPQHFDACYRMAQAYANLGQHQLAAHYAERAIEIDAKPLAPYYLLTHIALDQGALETAKLWLKKIIYLDPTAISAYLELGFLYEQEGDRLRTRKMQTTAIALLQQMPQALPVEFQDGVTAGELLCHINTLIQRD